MREIRPAFVGILSIWAETYSHTLSEAWAAGLPGPRHRPRCAEGASRAARWRMDPRSPRPTAGLRADPRDLRRRGGVPARARRGGYRWHPTAACDGERLRRAVPLHAPRPTDRARDAICTSRRGFDAPPCSSSAAPTVAPPPIRARPDVAASAGTRSCARSWRPRLVEVEDFIDGAVDDPDVAIVQRTAIPPDSSTLPRDGDGARHSARRRHRRQPLRNRFRRTATTTNTSVHLASLERLIAAADLVTRQHRRVSATRSRTGLAALRSYRTCSMSSSGSATSATPAARRGHAGAGRSATSRYVRDRAAAATFSVGLAARATSSTWARRTHADDLGIAAPGAWSGSGRVATSTSSCSWSGSKRVRSPGDHVVRASSHPDQLLHCPYAANSFPGSAARASAWDVAVAPLHDTAFNRCKSDLKFLEYAALGLPGIYSDVVPYKHAVRHEETGLLTENTDRCMVRGDPAPRGRRRAPGEHRRRGQGPRTHPPLSRTRCVGVRAAHP